MGASAIQAVPDLLQPCLVLLLVQLMYLMWQKTMLQFLLSVLLVLSNKKLVAGAAAVCDVQASAVAVDAAAVWSVGWTLLGKVVASVSHGHLMWACNVCPPDLQAGNSGVSGRGDLLAIP